MRELGSKWRSFFFVSTPVSRALSWGLLLCWTGPTFYFPSLSYRFRCRCCCDTFCHLFCLPTWPFATFCEWAEGGLFLRMHTRRSSFVKLGEQWAGSRFCCRLGIWGSAWGEKTEAIVARAVALLGIWRSSEVGKHWPLWYPHGHCAESLLPLGSFLWFISVSDIQDIFVNFLTWNRGDSEI